MKAEGWQYKIGTKFPFQYVTKVEQRPLTRRDGKPPLPRPAKKVDLNPKVSVSKMSSRDKSNQIIEKPFKKRVRSEGFFD